MSNEMKYVVVKSDEQGEQLFTFPKTIDHDKFAEVLNYIRHGDRDWIRIYREPISAGFVSDGKCYGRSETLNLDSRKEDTALLARGGSNSKSS